MQDAAPATRFTENVVDLAAAVQGAEQTLSSLRLLKTRIRNAVDDIKPTKKHIESIYELWEQVLENIQIFVSMVENIGDVRHPRFLAPEMTVLTITADSSIYEDSNDRPSLDHQGMPSPVAIPLHSGSLNCVRSL